MKRIAILRIEPDLLQNIFSEDKTFTCLRGIPADAQFRGFTIDTTRNCLLVFMEHESFSLTPEGSEYPFIESPVLAEIKNGSI